MPFGAHFKEFGQPASHKRKQAYDIGPHIGSGEFGEVKLATDIKTGKKVAIKIVSKSHFASLSAQTKRLNNYSKLSHPNVMKMHEWFESRERYYFVLQYLAGGELYDVVEKRGHLPEVEARDLALQLFEAIAFLHEHNIVHRDLKLENLLVDESHTHVVVGDMGLSVQLTSPDQLLYARCGSLGYTAPEVYSHNREGYGKPSDVWSLGVIIFIMLGGRFPFIGATPQEVAEEGIAKRIRFTNAPPWTLVSPEAVDLIRKLLEPDPSKRLTAKDALQHPWCTMSDEQVKNRDSNSSDAPSMEHAEHPTHRTDELQLRRTVTNKTDTDKLIV